MTAAATIPSLRTRPLARAARAVTGTYGLGLLVAAVLWLVTLGRTHRNSWLEIVFGLLNVPVGRSLVSVVVLGLITRALVGRKRVGLIAVAAFQVAGIYLGLVAAGRLAAAPAVSSWQSRETFGQVLDAASSVIAVLALWWLWRIRAAFPGRLRRGSWATAATTLLTGLAVAVATTWVLFTFTRQGGTHWRQVLAATLAALGDRDNGRGLLAGTPTWIPEVTAVIVSGSIILAVALFLRSARSTGEWSGERELRLRALLARFGDRDSLGYFATRRDKQSVFDPHDRAAVTYRVHGGVSLASGDPIGDPAAWGAAVGAWLAEARAYGWTPAVLGASEDGARMYAAHGLGAITLGDEAILDPSRFDLRTTAMTPVRHAAQRAARSGLVLQLRRQDQIEPEELREILRHAEQWRGDEPERGFSMALNRDGDPADGRILFATARDPQGALVGLLSFVPWGHSRVSLDLMRRSPQAPNGVTELLVCHLMAEAAGLGVREVSLNFCLFRTVYADAARIGTRPLVRLNNSVLGFFDRFWQLERLYRSNQKFDPRWYPRFVCLDDWVAIPQIAIVAAQLEGFLPVLPFTEPHRGAQLTPPEVAAARKLAIAPPPTAPEPRRADQTRHRIATIPDLERIGRDPYPVGSGGPTGTIARLHGDATPGPVTVAGRISRMRDHGGVVFADLSDGGSSTQLLLDAAQLGRDDVAGFARLVDVGDLIQVTVTAGRSRNGTRSSIVTAWTMLAKSLHPLPRNGFSDPQIKLRQRATDLLLHPEAVEVLRQRTTVIRSVREVLTGAGFLEVETPILHAVHGGATARPFRTYSNAYGMDLSLRIAPELYLKRLVVAGLGPVFEIGRNFRNEGADNTHNPEFTSLEAYLPYADYTVMRHLTERLVKSAASALTGSASLPIRRGKDDSEPGRHTDVSGPWAVVSVLAAVSRAVGREVSPATEIDVLLDLAREFGVEVPGDAGPGTVIEQLYAALVEPATMLPTFFVDFPAETSPLTRPHRSLPGLAERWDLVINGVELATAYSELTDPLEQRRRLTAQSARAAAGDLEAMEVDEDFLRDLETGMPPTGGLGIGIDRLVMLLTGTTIRSVLTFPFVKPADGSSEPPASQEMTR